MELTVKEIKANLRYDIAATKKEIRNYAAQKDFCRAAIAKETLNTLEYVMALIRGEME